MMDPVHEHDAKWWFFDETWADEHGPYDTEKQAREELALYSAHLQPKPEAKLIGADGNIFVLIGLASLALRKAGLEILSKEMKNKITASAHCYDDALAIIMQYVEAV
jgi:hypothetical protein